MAQAAAAAAAKKLKDEADRQSMKKYDLLNYVINSFIDDFYPNNPELTTQQLIDKEEAAQAARRSFQYIMGGVFFADTIEEIPFFGKILALVFEMVKSLMGILGGLSATLLPLPFGVLPFGSFIGAFVGWLVSMIFFLPYAAMSFSQKQFSDTAVGLFSMIPIIGIPIANMFKSGLKSGSKIYFLSSKATEEVMALVGKIRSVAQTATEHSFAPGEMREKLLKTAAKLQEQARQLANRTVPLNIGRSGYKEIKTPARGLNEKTPLLNPPPSAPPADVLQKSQFEELKKLIDSYNPTPSARNTVVTPDANGNFSGTNPMRVKRTSARPNQTYSSYQNINLGGKRFTRRHAIRRKCLTVKHRQSRKH